MSATINHLNHAVAALRQPGAAPNAANDLIVDVLPTVQDMADALEAGINRFALRAGGIGTISPLEQQWPPVQKMIRALERFNTGTPS